MTGAAGRCGAAPGSFSSSAPPGAAKPIGRAAGVSGVGTRRFVDTIARRTRSLRDLRFLGPLLPIPGAPIDFPAMSQPRAPQREPVLPDRVRVLPRHFAWVDHRLRDRLWTLTPVEMALLFFLHLVADRSGLSFWADSTIAKKLGLKEGDVIEARYGLVAKGFIAYRYPLFQILPIEDRHDAR